MSQQTTLAVVIPKFSEFLKHLPTVYDLAAGDEEKLRQLWCGLGYYARTRNLKKGARYIVEQLDGRFPQSYREWLEIPGCGPYTAAVIASICLNEKVACMDGNVVRVVSRLLALSKDVWSSSGQSVIRGSVTSMIPDERPGDFNQAMMELGATVCADLARLAAKKAGVSVSSLIARPTREFGLIALRPTYSVLGSSRGELLPCLDSAIERYFDERQ